MPGFKKTGHKSSPKSDPLKQQNHLYLGMTSHVVNVLVSAPERFPWKWAGQKWNFTAVAAAEIGVWGLD